MSKKHPLGRPITKPRRMGEAPHHYYRINVVVNEEQLDLLDSEVEHFRKELIAKHGELPGRFGRSSLIKMLILPELRRRRDDRKSKEKL